MWCMRLAENTGRKKLPYRHHRTTLSSYIFATKARIDNRKKSLLSSNISPACPHNMVNFGPLAAQIISLCSSYNWNKTTQNNSKTNPKKPQKNQNNLFWVCFCASYMWNKTLKQYKSRRGLSVNQSLLRSATLLSRQLYVIMQLLTLTHYVYNNNSFVFNAGMDVRDIKFSDLVILHSCIQEIY